MHRLEPSVLDPRLLVAAYRQGFFPMATENGRILWYDPNPRAILPLDGFHASRRLLRTVRTARFEVGVDMDFRGVIKACAEPAPGREQTWISSDIVDAYCQLHRLGLAHSVETRREGTLVGGVYGVAVGGLFAAESMFSRSRDASKVALVHLVERLRRGGFLLMDVQFLTPHLMRLGAIEVPRARYKALLATALQTHAEF